ncbi:Glycosyltransferases involved in cell wall biogenesis [Alteromonadaceae bacterium Bs31]|nr:Glycosyltransferases involved in cell wall biogenesis [Alteromonadaceae bacterium Bs31]
MTSVVIPAHNEETVIARCLQALEPGSSEMEIVVVCNGCKDRTAEIARTFAGVKVVETDVPSKANALNLGDNNASSFPRVYLDADIMLSLQDLTTTVNVVRESTEVLAAAPTIQFDLSKSSLFVKAFYSVWQKLPYFSTKHMIGSGIYILSEQGRKRFTAFPNIISDDGYVRSLFTPDERRTIDGAVFKVFAPSNLNSLIKIKTRARFGNMEVVHKYPGSKLGGENSPYSLLSLVLKKPWLLPAAFIYAYVQWQTKRLSMQRFKSEDYTTWERDESAR